jgi:hypothetical protein
MGTLHVDVDGFFSNPFCSATAVYEHDHVHVYVHVYVRKNRPNMATHTLQAYALIYINRDLPHLSPIF